MLPEERFYRELLERVERKFSTAASPRSPRSRAGVDVHQQKKMEHLPFFSRLSLPARWHRAPRDRLDL